jgi:tetratricopeptide (TPR) repeat protein
VQKAEIAGVGLYRQALATQDGDQALALLEQAVRANPRLSEAWYELGRRKVKQATILVKTDESQAVQMFREGLGAEQEALRLLDEGTVIVWSATEQEEARAVLQTDLQNAEEAMTGPEALLSALRQRTY